MRKKIRYCLVGVLLIIALWVATYINLFVFFQKHAYAPAKIDFIINDTSSHDIVFFGSSKVQVLIDPKIIDSITHLNSYNLGFDGTNIPYYYALLERYLCSHHALPKYVGISLDAFSFNMGRKISLFPDYYYPAKHDSVLGKTLDHYFPFYKDNAFCLDAVFKRLYELPDEIKLKAVFGHYDNAVDGYIDSKTDIELPPYKGYTANMATWSEQSEKQLGDKWHIDYSPDGLDVLQKIIDLCKEKKVTLFFICAPMYKEWVHVIPQQDSIDNLMFAALHKNNSILFNFLNDPLSQSRYNFFDISHLNNTAAQLYTKELGRVIRDSLLTKN